MVRVRGEFLHISAEVIRAGDSTELLFPLAFDARRFDGIAEKRLLVCSDVAAERSKRDSRKENGCNGDGAIHGSPRMRGNSACRREGLEMKQMQGNHKDRSPLREWVWT